MSARDAAEQRLEQRMRLLEIEAEMQRVALNATFATWAERRTLVWGSALGAVALRLLAVPRVRWLVVASLLAKLKPKSRR